MKWYELREYKWNEYVTIAVNRDLSNCEMAKKKSFSGLQRDWNPWPLRSCCSALPAELRTDPYTGGRRTNLFFRAVSLFLRWSHIHFIEKYMSDSEKDYWVLSAGSDKKTVSTIYYDILSVLISKKRIIRFSHHNKRVLFSCPWSVKCSKTTPYFRSSAVLAKGHPNYEV